MHTKQVHYVDPEGYVRHMHKGARRLPTLSEPLVPMAFEARFGSGLRV